MELINSNRQQTGLVVAGQDAKCVAIRERYGELPAFTTKYTPAKQRQCYHNVTKAVEAGAPSFVMIKKAYGDQGITAFIKTHVAEAIIRLGEDRDVDDNDTQFIAEAIVDSDRTQTLTLASVIGFFYLLKCGEFDIYGKVTPRKVLEAFRKYADKQQAIENRIAFEKEQREKEAADEEARKNAITWEEFAASQGIDPEGGLAGHLIRQANAAREQKEREKQAGRNHIIVFLEAINQLNSVLAFVADYCRIKKIPLQRPETP